MTEVAAIPPNCIPANPDVAGVGIRASIYVQNIWCLGITLWVLRHREIKASRARLIQTLSTTIVLTTGALFSSAFIQAAVYGLSAYHAIVVLSLGWVNYASLVLYTCVAEDIQSSPASNSETSSWHRSLNPFAPLDSSRFGFFCALWAHASFGMFAAFGLWFWATVDTFGSTSQCAPRLSIPIQILGHTFLSTKPTTRNAFLAVYAYFTLVSLIGIIKSVWVLACPRITQQRGNHFRPFGSVDLKHVDRVAQIVGFSASVGTLVAIVVSTESMVRKAALFVRRGESEWTYGQTVSIFLLVPGLLETLYVLTEREPVAVGNNEQQSGTQGDRGDVSTVNNV